MPLGLGIENSSKFGESSSVASVENGPVEGTELAGGRNRLRTSCIKCPGKSQVVINVRDTYCNKCFLEEVRHKFRSTVAREKVFRNDDRKAIVAFDGGQSCVTLLNLIQGGLSANAKRRLLLDPILVTILTSIDGKEMENESLVDYLKSTGYSCHLLHLGSVFKTENLQTSEISPNCNKAVDFETVPGFEFAPKLQELLESVKSETAANDLRFRFKMYLLQRLAERFKAKKIIVGTTAQSLAKKTLVFVALGRGSQIASETAVVDRRGGPGADNKIAIVIRPLRNFSEKEIALYNHFEGLDAPVKIDKMSLSVDKELIKPSVQLITENFVDELQAGFPSTVTTILSTTGKVQGHVRKGQNRVCILCFSDFGSDTSDDKFCWGCKSSMDDVGDRKLLPDFLS